MLPPRKACAIASATNHGIRNACFSTAVPEWHFYAPSAAPSPDTAYEWVTLIVVGGLALAAVALNTWDASVVARNPCAPTLGDRLAGTRIAGPIA